MTISDQELIHRARQGESGAFGRLWERYEAQVVALCRRYMASPHRDPATEAADLAGETFIVALHALSHYEDRTREGATFGGWLLEIAKRRCLKSLERQRRRQQWHCSSPHELLAEVPDREEATPQLVEEREALRIAAEEINALPELYRLPFQLTLEERSHKEIAEMLGITAGSVMQRVHRARRLLQPRLAPLFGIEPGVSQRSAAALHSVERALSNLVGDSRVVSITLPGGGELQLCLRIERRLAVRGAEIAARRRAVQRRPRAWKPYLEFAELCYHCGLWREAREAFRTVLERNPGCHAAALRLGEMLRREDQAAEAAKVLRAALEHASLPGTAARLRAEALEASGDDVPAVEAYREAIASAPADAANYYGLHRVLGRLSRYAEQLENLESLRRVYPGDLFSYVEAYTPCARLKRWDLARPLLDCALEIDPNYPLAVKHLFQVRMNQKQYDSQTLALAERLVRLAPDFVESWSELAWIYSKLGQDEESLAVLNQFLSEHPTNAEGYAALAWRYHYLGRTGDMVAHARRAYELAPSNLHVCWTMMDACKPGFGPVSVQEALGYGAEIAARFPGDAFLLERICHVFAEWERFDEAMRVAEQLRALLPAETVTEHRLADIYRLCHRWTEAARSYRRLLDLPAERSVVLLANCGEVMARLNDPEADALFLEAEERVQSWYDIAGLASVYERCGLTERARAAVQRLASYPEQSSSMRRHAVMLASRLGI